MRARVFWLGAFRFLVLLFSLATLACNIGKWDHWTTTSSSRVLTLLSFSLLFHCSKPCVCQVHWLVSWICACKQTFMWLYACLSLSLFQYILYIVGPGVSIICSLALNVVSISSVKSTRGDRTLSILNLALMIAVIVYNTLKSGVVPWKPEPDADAPSSATPGFATYCTNYHDSTTANRCCK